MAAFIKLIQYLTVAWWYIRVAPVVGMADFTTLRLLAAGLLLAGGQILNAATYRALGKAGVYYGFKLGRTVPWCTGFPFNTPIRHPQYTGSVLTIWGAAIAVYTPEHWQAGLHVMVFAWTLFYVITSFIEGNC
jgi:protein-S-isoprenylcysteine O-methyltransferase Ste14